MELGLKDKVIAITGGTSGIGEEVAVAFAKEGAKLAVCGRNSEKIEAIRKRFQDLGFPLMVMSVNVADNDQLKAFADGTEQEFGRIDIWLNNAGTNIHRPFDELSEEEWHHLVNTNLKSTFFGCAFAAEKMKKTGGGVIINTSSFTSILPTAGKALYSATKAAIDTLTSTLAVELASDHIRVVGLAPGYTVTPLTEKNVAFQYDTLVSGIALNRLATPDDMTGAYLFLASDAASYISGITLPVAGAKFCTQNPMWSWNRPTKFV